MVASPNDPYVVRYDMWRDTYYVEDTSVSKRGEVFSGCKETCEDIASLLNDKRRSRLSEPVLVSGAQRMR